MRQLINGVLCLLGVGLALGDATAEPWPAQGPELGIHEVVNRPLDTPPTLAPHPDNLLGDYFGTLSDFLEDAQGWACAPNGTVLTPWHQAQHWLDRFPDGEATFYAHLDSQRERWVQGYVLRLESSMGEMQGPSALGISMLQYIRRFGKSSVGVLGLRLMALESAWAPPVFDAVRSYFAQQVLQSGHAMSDTIRRRLEELQGTSYVNKRLYALIGLAFSQNPMERELFRQIVYTLDPTTLKSVHEWVGSLAPEDPAPACTLLRLVNDPTQSQWVSRLMPIPELARAVVPKAVELAPNDRASLPWKDPPVQTQLLASLLSRDVGDHVRADAVSLLEPPARALHDTLIPWSRDTVHRAMAPPEVPQIPEFPERARVQSVSSLSDIYETWDQRGWTCDENGWESARQRAYVALAENPGLRSQYLSATEGASKAEFADIVRSFASGQMTFDDLFLFFFDFHTKYWITAEAAVARRALLLLETDPQSKSFLASVLGVYDGAKAGPTFEQHREHFLRAARAGRTGPRRRHLLPLISLPPALAHEHKAAIKEMDLVVGEWGAGCLPLLAHDLIDQLLHELDPQKPWTQQAINSPFQKRILGSLAALGVLSMEVFEQVFAFGVIQNRAGVMGSPYAKTLAAIAPAEAGPYLRKRARELGVLQQLAIETLGELGEDADNAATLLHVGTVQLNSPWIQEVAAAAFAKSASPQMRALVLTADGLQSSKTRHRTFAIEVLGHSGMHAKSHIGTLEQILAGPPSHARTRVPRALIRIGGATQIDLVVAALKDDDWLVRQSAAQGLAELDPGLASRVAPALFQSAKVESSDEVRSSMLAALLRLGAWDQIDRALFDADSPLHLRRAVVESVAPRPADRQAPLQAYRVLVIAVGNPAPEVHLRAVTLIERLSATQRAQVCALLRALGSDSRPEVRELAPNAMKRLEHLLE